MKIPPPLLSKWKSVVYIWLTTSMLGMCFPTVYAQVRVGINGNVSVGSEHQTKFFGLTPKSWTVSCFDHIKVWQKQNDCNQDYQVCNYNSNTYDYRVHKNVNIDGQNCNTIINPSADIQAEEGITVYENTLIERGILRTEPCEESLYFNWQKTITSKEIQLWQELHTPR